MLYNKQREEWEHSGGLSGISRVHLYHRPVNNTYRIVGRKVQDHTVCLQLVIGKSFFVFNSDQLEWNACPEVILTSVHPFVHMECVPKCW